MRSPLIAVVTLFVLALAQQDSAAQSADLYGDPLPEGATVRLGTDRYRLSAWGGNITFSADSKRLLLPSGGALIVRDVVTGKRVREVPLGPERSRVLCYTQDRQQVVTSRIEYDEQLQNDMTRIAVTDLATGMTRQLATWAFREEYGSPSGGAISPDGRRLMLGTRHGVGFWDMQTGELVHQQQLTGRDHGSLHFTSDGETIVAASSRTSPVISHWQADNEQHALPHERRQAATAAISPDDRLVVTAGEGFVRVWNLSTRELLRELRQGRDGRVSSRGRLAFTPDSRLLAVPIHAARRSGQIDGDDSIEVWDVQTGELVRSLSTHSPTVVAISPDGTWLACSGTSSFVRVWNLQSGEPVGREYLGHEQVTYTLLFAPDGSQVLVGSVSGDVVVWDAETGRQLRKWHVAPSYVRNLAISPDGKLLATFGYDDRLKVWDFATAEQIYSLPGDGFLGGKGALSFTADGEYLAVWGDHKKQLQMFSARTGEQVRDYSTATEEEPAEDFGNRFDDIVVANFSPDAKFMTITEMRGKTAVWEIAAEERSTEFVVPFADWYNAMLLPNADAVALVCLRPGPPLPLPNGAFKPGPSETVEIRVYDLRRGSLLRQFPLQAGSRSSCDLSPDGRLLAITREDPYGLCIYDFETGQLLRELTTGTILQTRPKFSPDGRHIATVDACSNIIIRDLERLPAVDAQE